MEVDGADGGQNELGGGGWSWVELGGSRWSWVELGAGFREPELFYILAELFSKCLNESCFPGFWKVSWLIPIFKNVGEKYTAKTYYPVSLLSVVSKVLEKLVNNRIVDLLEKCGIFSDFQYSFRSS